MKIAITGCNGSVGTRVVLAALAQGHTVHGIDTVPCSEPLAGLLLRAQDITESKFEFSIVDLMNFEVTLAALEGADAVVHLAAVSTPADYKAVTHNTNVVLSWNVLRAAAELKIARVAQASSVNVIPLVWTDHHDFEYFPLDEEHPCRPDEPYGLSKVYVLSTFGCTCRRVSLKLAFCAESASFRRTRSCAGSRSCALPAFA
ncbi:hypothetical protein BC628DRAFT_663552 [Trametes gibbosa]|nr:hypothetical protein BC628DRAFT_663552 [Trametes gibbosa]